MCPPKTLRASACRPGLSDNGGSSSDHGILSVYQAFTSHALSFFDAAPKLPGWQIATPLGSSVDERRLGAPSEVNDTFLRISGWTRDEVIGRTPFDINIWRDPSQRLAFVARLLAGGIVRNLEVHARLKNGESWTGSGSAALIEINGETCVLSITADCADIH